MSVCSSMLVWQARTQLERPSIELETEVFCEKLLLKGNPSWNPPSSTEVVAKALSIL